MNPDRFTVRIQVCPLCGWWCGDEYAARRDEPLWCDGGFDRPDHPSVRMESRDMREFEQEEAK